MTPSSWSCPDRGHLGCDLRLQTSCNSMKIAVLDQDVGTGELPAHWYLFGEFCLRFLLSPFATLACVSFEELD